MEDMIVHVDGAIAGGQHSGIAAVARTEEGHFLGWQSRQLPPVTNNEAEYQATLLGLSLARELGATAVLVVTDSEVVVRQMQGLSRVLSPRLKPLHLEACRRVADFQRVTFRHVSREENKLADALAAEALVGQEVRMAPRRGLWRMVGWGGKRVTAGKGLG